MRLSAAEVKKNPSGIYAVYAWKENMSTKEFFTTELEAMTAAAMAITTGANVNVIHNGEKVFFF